MNTYLKITITLMVAILLASLTRVHYLSETIDKKLQQEALEKFNILTNITKHHILRHYKIENINEESFSFTQNFKYETKLIVLTKDGKIEDKNQQKGVDFLNSNKNATYYFNKLGDGQYTFISELKELTNKKARLFFFMKVDSTQELQKTKNKYLYVFYAIFAVILFIFAVTYKILKKYHEKEKQFLTILQNEISSKTKELHKKNQELEYKYYNDTLTNLPNRSKLIEDLEDNVDIKKCLLLVNLDNFKEINDFYGLKIGDEVLISFGNFLSSQAEKHSITAYKLHADEYALLSFNTNKEFLLEYIKELLLQIKHLSIMTEDDYTLEIQATIGISIDRYDLISSANMALKKAKKDHLSYLFYDESLKIKNEYKHNLKWTKKIKKAIKNDKILAYCQPIVNPNDSDAKKFEVLARLQDGDGKIISPFFFLDVAKKNKFYPNITKTIIKQAFETFENTDFEFSINISILDILNPTIVNFIIDMIKKYPKPQNIHFEILESEGIKNFDEILEFIKILKQYSCKISIDDFGSGYSNFEHILKLQVDTLKIDASLIKNIDKDSNAHAIVSTIISFANKLDINTCAEFVHSEDVYKELLKLKTTYLQGYYISEPFPIKDAKNFTFDVK